MHIIGDVSGGTIFIVTIYTILLGVYCFVKVYINIKNKIHPADDEIKSELIQ